jgi:hypothetical protein
MPVKGKEPTLLLSPEADAVLAAGPDPDVVVP